MKNIQMGKFPPLPVKTASTTSTAAQTLMLATLTTVLKIEHKHWPLHHRSIILDRRAKAQRARAGMIVNCARWPDLVVGRQ